MAGHPGDVVSEKKLKSLGDITLRPGRSAEHTLVCVKTEPAVTNEGHISHVYGMEERPSLNIKEEHFSGDEGTFHQAVVSTPLGNSEDSTINIKEESFSSEGMESTTDNIKEESGTGGEGILTGTDIYSTPAIIIKVKPFSCKREHQRNLKMNAHEAHTLGTSIQKKPGRKLNASQMVDGHRDCSKRCSTNSRLINHHRVETITSPQRGENFSCNSGLTRHRTEKTLPCSKYGKCVSSKPDLIVHQRIHKGEKPFACLDRGQRFLFESQLVGHQIKHAGEKPFPCSECGKSYSSKAAIVMHERLHTGNNLYSCPECGKKFVRKSHLQQHVSLHTGEKPYACPECGKRFIQKSNLKQHLSVHMPKKKETYCCTECGKFYKRRADFRWHMLIHLGEK
ncbi:uncharacterized protein LOC142663439 isoform X2 [Rhinoderma darwinii]|uniref:uncharacterized protein LOC142663439 isoform X2 n=1 Tax=Rhinoderma darwinii TaxID=43563 RepID=UPI003F67F477